MEESPGVNEDARRTSLYLTKPPLPLRVAPLTKLAFGEHMSTTTRPSPIRGPIRPRTTRQPPRRSCGWHPVRLRRRGGLTLREGVD